MTTTPGPSDPTEVAGVDLLAKFQQRDGLLRVKFPSRAWRFFDPRSKREVVGGVVGFIGFSPIFGLIKNPTWHLYI